MEAPSRSGNESEILFHLRWVAKIALSVGAMAAAGLGITLNILTDGSGTSYGELIQSHSIVHAYLGPALLIGGFFLLAATAFLTWLIALYSSFRIAGPLFRFSRNLENAIAHGPAKPIPIREGDRLHQDALLLERALLALEGHYCELGEEIELALARMEGGAIERARLQATTAQLAALVKRADV